MATLLEAVGGDTFGGLSGYRRPTAGNPTRVPTNLPAFRGTPNTPGQKVSAPAIQSSKNRNNRGTNVLIPYSRITTYDGREVGGRCRGSDLYVGVRAECAVGRARRLPHHLDRPRRLPLFALDRPVRAQPDLANLGARNGQGTLMNVYVQTDASKSVADYWYEVPT